jgi:acetyl-CoA decarbonylase/synthase complex subunit gamma
MALSGIQIFKLLPKTNCKECGFPTCLAFAMSLAQGKTELEKCPYVSDDTKAQLSEESAPPIRTVEIGAGASAIKVGGETVLFRHEKTFFNPAGIALMARDTDGDVDAKLARIKELQYERVGLTLKANLVCAKCESGNADTYVALVKKAKDTGMALILMASGDPLRKALEAVKDAKPLIYAATEANADEMGALAKEAGCPLAVKADGLDALAALTKKLSGAGLKDLVMDFGSRSMKQSFTDHVAARRLAIQKTFRDLGFPTIALPCEMTDDFMMESLYAATFIAKYASVIVMSDLRGENLFPLLLERLNIYTDPQRPMKTDAKIYELNNPTPRSPVLVTCNFSLTYFIVSGEIEASRQPAYLAVVDTDGLSVLTAWAAGKFVGDSIGPFIQKSGIAEKLEKPTLVLPGATAVISGDVEEELGSGWDVKIGPREAAHITPFLKDNFGS